MKNWPMVVAAGLIALVVAWVLLPSEDESEPARSAGKESGAETARAFEPSDEDREDVGYGSYGGDEDVAEDGPTWAFEGQVFDLLREEPIPDAKVVFSNDFVRGVTRGETVTDESGSYYLEVSSKGGAGYNVRIEHTDFDSRNTYSPSVLDKSRAEKMLLGTGVQFHGVDGTYTGDESFSTSLDFYVYPHNLTQEEQRERSDAMRQLRGGGGP